MAGAGRIESLGVIGPGERLQVPGTDADCPQGSDRLIKRSLIVEHSQAPADSGSR